MKIGICTGGGDCPGLNAAIKAFVESSVSQHNSEIVGIYDSFDGLEERPLRTLRLGLAQVADIQEKGGTILGTCNSGKTFSDKSGAEQMTQVIDGFNQLGLEALVVIGGEGTQTMAKTLSTKIPVIGIPKTIDNDLPGTDQTIGFSSCVDLVADSVMRLRSTAESHHRVMVMEVMGRDSGYIALHGGIAGGANVILIPEIPFSIQAIQKTIEARHKRGINFSVIVVSEGATAKNQEAMYQEMVDGKKILGGIGQSLAHQLFKTSGIETRVTVLGHLQRGGAPNAADKILATRFAAHAADLVHREKFGELVVIKDSKIGSVRYQKIDPSVRRKIDLQDELLTAARVSGICLGS